MRSAVHWLVPAAGVGYAALASTTRPLTWTASVAVAVPVLVVLIRTVRPHPGGPSGRETTGTGAGLPGPGRRTAAAWGAVVVLAAALELVAFLRQPAYDVAAAGFPTLSVLLDPLTGAGATRFLVWCCWLWAGWALARR